MSVAMCVLGCAKPTYPIVGGPDYTLLPTQPEALFYATGAGGWQYKTIDVRDSQPLARSKPWKIARLPSSLPSFSATGSTMAFLDRQGDEVHVCVADAQGHVQNVLPNSGYEVPGPPTVSDDGTKVVYFASHYLNRAGMGPPWLDWDLHVSNTRGNEGRRITHRKWFAATPPRLSADGRKAVFSARGSDSSGNVQKWQIFACDLSSGSVQQLTPSTWSSVGPDVSPNGHRVVFVSDRNGDRSDGTGDQQELWTMDISGASAKRMGSTGIVARMPRFLPSGRSILCLRRIGKTGGTGLWKVQLDGGGLRKLVDEPDVY
jgi:hypothetical protein